MRLIVKLFGLQYVNYFVKFEQTDEERTKEAMDFLISEGMHFRVLPENYEAFYKELITGSKEDKVWRSVLFRKALDTVSKEESYQLAAHILLAPYAKGTGEWPEQIFFKANHLAASKLVVPVPMLGYVKILTEALIEVCPTLPIDVARAVAFSVYHTNKFFKGVKS